MKEKKKRAKRLPTFAESITPIIAMLLILTIGKACSATARSRS